jgi:sterol desaturase/sphingolipid hydroxylase (fatty acid hydroxylase superfamily)
LAILSPTFLLHPLLLIISILYYFEIKKPKRKLNLSKTTRWFINFTLIFISSLTLRLVAPSSIALFAQTNNIGLFNLIQSPFETIISIVLLDLLIYQQHVLFHRIPFFWRFHKIHHIDQEMDQSTGIRFHPLEMFFSALIKCCFILILGIDFKAVILFEVLLNSAALFSHANIRLSKKADSIFMT